MLLRVCGAVDRGVTALGMLIAWATVLPLIAVSFYDIVGRQFFNTGSTRLQELEWHFFLALVMMSLGWAYLRDAHVRIDILRHRFAPRMRAWMEVIGFVVFLSPLCLLLVVYGGELTLGAFASGERSRSALGLPMRWIIMSTLPLGGLLLLLAGVSIAVRNALFLASGVRGRGTMPDAGMPTR